MTIQVMSLTIGKGLFNTLARAPAHLPEVCLESGSFLEDRNQLCLPGRRGVEIGEMLQVRPRFRRDLLVWHAGVLGEASALAAVAPAASARTELPAATPAAWDRKRRRVETAGIGVLISGLT